MSGFSPLTLGYDWEVFALKPEMLPGEDKKFEKIAERVNRELAPIEAHREWRFIEMGPGVVRDWTELADRTDRYVKWVREEFAKEELVFFPCGAIATDHGTAGMHVHVGTICDAAAEAHIQNALVKYTPPLLALTVNSPAAAWHSGKWKSYRMSGYWWGSGGVYTVAPPHLSMATWAGDVCFRRSEKPTIEIRLADSFCSPRLLTEYALVIAGLADWIGEHIDSEPVSYSPEEFDEFLVNRWRAVKDGLQATFICGGAETSAVDEIREIIEKASPGIRKLNASPEDLVIIPKMLEKRQTQADFQMRYLERLGDLVSYQRAFADAIQDPTAFEQYLNMAPALPQAAPADLDEALLQKIGRETRLEGLMTDPIYPPVVLENRLRRLEREGRVILKTTPEDGIRCSRVRREKPLSPQRTQRGKLLNH